MLIAEIIYLVTAAAIGMYALFKEREESACLRWSIGRQCDDDESVYVRGTAPQNKDTAKVLAKRIESSLSYHEKAGVWKRCYLIGTVLVLIVWLALTLGCTKQKHVNAWLLISLHLVFVAVLYFYMNYINYHHLRRLKENGVTALHMLMASCGSI